jgi:hypothetical protein
MLVGTGPVATVPGNLGRRHWGEFAGNRTETRAAPFPAAGV